MTNETLDFLRKENDELYAKSKKYEMLYNKALTDLVHESKRVSNLEKALDKACGWLEFYEHLYDDGEYDDWKTKEQWKEHFLKEVKE